jgi:acyl-coenzyme A thioesterase PaaI-like protein
MTTSYGTGPPHREDSIQDRFFANAPCWGCGPGNTKGLQLKSFEAADDTVRARFQPWPEHDNGLGFLNGGIIATLLDCHSAAAVVLGSAERGLSPDGTLQYVTAGIDVRYLRPSPLREPADLLARLISVDESRIVVDAELWWQDKVRATATSTWKRWRPRERTGTPPPAH